jgi:ABC-type multidrug transport system fused ATPase/permease subunit
MPRPIAPSAVVERIWSLYRAEAGVLVPVAAVLFAIQLVIALLLPIGLALVLSVLFLVLSLLYQGFVVELVAQSRAGATTGASTADLVRAVTPAIGPLLVITLLFAFGVILGFVLIIVPGLVLLTFWCVVVPVEVLERRGVIGSFARSRELVRGNGWNVFGVIVIVYVAVLAVSLLASIVSAPLGHVGRDIVQWAVNVAVTPIVALSASVLYFELIDAGAS